MKRILAAVLAAVMLIMTACTSADGNGDKTPENNETETTATENNGTPKTDTDDPETTDNSSGEAEGGKKSEDGLNAVNVGIVVPTSYRQVYDVLEKYSYGRGYGGYYSNGVYATDDMEVEEAEVEYEMPAPDVAAEPMEKSYAEPTSASSADDYSGTNTQVEGIDEGDIVKTDGKYIYVLRNERELAIVSADGENSKVLSMITLAKGNGHYDSWNDDNWENYRSSSSWCYYDEMYVYNGYVAVIGNYSYWFEEKNGDIYNYDSDDYLVLEIYDCTDPTNPVLKADLGQDGYYTDSRMIGDTLYLISEKYTYFYNVDEKDYSSYIPATYADGMPELVPVEDIMYPVDVETTDCTIIAKYSISDAVKTDVKTVYMPSDTIYMNSENLYIAGSVYSTMESEPYKVSIYTVRDYVNGTNTEIMKISLESLESVACGTINGYLYDQFALDEYNGYLRAVTTTNGSNYSIYTDEELGFSNYKWGDSVSVNNLIILDANLNEAGSVRDLAAGERVYSVRLSGNVGYIVTFRNTDPLFAIDLSDPANPKVMSALKIPGFSRYLHPYSDTLLFGLGQDADEKTGWVNSMKLSMFDVSDPFDVTECSKLIIDTSYSTALYNHKAIFISPEKGLIGFPTESGYVVYTYSDGCFSKLNEIDFGEDYYWWNGTCRGLYSGNYFYIAGSEGVAVFTLDNFDLVKMFEY